MIKHQSIGLWEPWLITIDTWHQKTLFVILVYVNHKIKRSCPGSRPEWGEPTAKLMEPQLVWGLDRSFSLWGATTSSRWVSEMISLSRWWGRIIKTAETCGPECWPQVVPADWTLSLRLYSCFVIDLNILFCSTQLVKIGLQILNS